MLSTLPFLERPLRRLERHPVAHGLLLSTMGLRHPLFVDHPVRPEARFGYGRPVHPEIQALLERGRPRYARHLSALLSYRERFATIPRDGAPEGKAPYWLNGWLPPPDAAALYGFVTEENPRHYIEIGSGNSTKFVRRAIEDHRLWTQVTSIDPSPRATIDELCDVVIRTPLEHADLEVFTKLEAGDVIFFDGSHRIFPGSDVTVFFLEILPRLRPGVLVHIHDILLPRDYPPEMQERYYSEQYLLAAFLLAGTTLFDVELPNAFVGDDPELSGILEPLWRALGLPVNHQPASFWLRMRERTPIAPVGRRARHR
jgi:predicted O-methyltransferase YrrM